MKPGIQTNVITDTLAISFRPYFAVKLNELFVYKLYNEQRLGHNRSIAIGLSAENIFWRS